jgi:hypothetical protein
MGTVTSSPTIWPNTGDLFPLGDVLELFPHHLNGIAVGVGRVELDD